MSIHVPIIQTRPDSAFLCAKPRSTNGWARHSVACSGRAAKQAMDVHPAGIYHSLRTGERRYGRVFSYDPAGKVKQ